MAVFCHVREGEDGRGAGEELEGKNQKSSATFLAYRPFGAYFLHHVEAMELLFGAATSETGVTLGHS